MRTVRLALLLWMPLFAWCLHAQSRAQLMVLGTTHFDNPNRDISNMAVDDVLQPTRQKQIQLLIEAIARFKPTRIAIEMPPSAQLVLNHSYAEYRAGRYTLTANERDQLGLRLATMLKLPQLDAVDYKGGPPGPDDAYDFSAYAAAHDLEARYAAFLAEGKKYAAEETEYLKTHTMLDWFRRANAPAYRLANNRFYFRMLQFGDSQHNPGANWVGGWHARNLIILENVRRLAKPQDRVLIIFGAGHSYLLDQFARESGTFEVVDTESFLSH